MKFKPIYLLGLLLIIPLFFINGAGEMPVAAEGPAFQDFVHPYGEEPAELQALLDPGATTTTHIAVHGHNWVPEFPNKYKYFRSRGWGTEVKIKTGLAPTDQWIHVTVPILTRINDVNEKVNFVQFCMKSSNPGVTKPTRMDIWDHDVRFSTATVTYPNAKGIQCISRSLTATWRADIGISVLIHFHKDTHMIVLYKAWVQSQP